MFSRIFPWTCGASCRVTCLFAYNLDNPPPYLQKYAPKICHKMRGRVASTSPWPFWNKEISRTFMAYKPHLWHTNPHFYAAWTVFIGDGWPFFTQISEGISFPNFVERPVLKLPSSKLCAVPLPLQNRAFSEGRQRRKDAWPAKGAKGKKGAWKQLRNVSPRFFRPRFFPGRPPKCLVFLRIWRVWPKLRGRNSTSTSST